MPHKTKNIMAVAFACGRVAEREVTTIVRLNSLYEAECLVP